LTWRYRQLSAGRPGAKHQHPVEPALQRLLMLGAEPGDRGVIRDVLRADDPMGRIDLVNVLERHAGAGTQVQRTW
jgi:hypothetical protein